MVEQKIKHSFPDDWNLEPFYLISSMNGRIGWQGLKQSEFTQNPDDPFLITGMNFKDGKIRWDEVYHILKKRYDEAKNIQLKKADVLITKDGTIGKVLFVDNIPYPHKASLNSHLLVFRPLRKKYEPKFLFYQLQSKPFLEHIEENKSGTTFFGITEKSIGKYNAFLPPIPEQEAISESLSDIDNLIDSLESLIEKKKNIKQGTMQELLTGKRRLEGFSGEWETMPFDKIFLKIPTKNFQIKTSEYKNSGKYPIIDQGKEKICGYTDNEKKVFSCPKNGIIIFGDHTREVKFVNENFVIGADGTQIISTKNSSDITKFFFYQIKIKNIPNTGYNRHFKFLLEYEFFQPQTDEQEAISKILSDMDSEIEQLEKQFEKYTNLKQAMMQKLLTGEIRLV